MMFILIPLGRLSRGWDRLTGNRERIEWMLKRAGEQRSAMFNEAWIGLAALLLVIGFLVGQGALPLLSALLLTIVGLSWLWNRIALSSVEYARQFSVARAFAGEVIDLTVSLTNRKFLPLAWIHVEDRVPTKLPFLDARIASTEQPTIGALSHLTATRWFERVNWHYKLECKHRGYYFFGPTRMRSGDIFGLFTSALTLDAQTRRVLQDELIRIWAETGKTFVYVTHSLEEAVLLGTRIVLMTARPGRIKRLIEVTLDRPRRLTRRADAELLETLDALLRDEVKQAMGAEA